MKHAYLVVAHHQFDVLIKTINILDDVNNDFYIHIDKKIPKVPFEDIANAAKYSQVTFVSRMKVNWGGYSQIKCTLCLLKEASKKKYDYMHLISGADLPIKNKNEIFTFFETHRGEEFVEIKGIEPIYLERIRRHTVSRDVTKIKALYRVDSLIHVVERLFGIDRLKANPLIKFLYSSNWFSITYEFAQYVLQQEAWIEKTFSQSLCADELFIQTLLENSPFKANITKENCMNVRKIDFGRGNPYVWRQADFEELINSNALFARKFDENIDNVIIDEIYKYCLEENYY